MILDKRKLEYSFTNDGIADLKGYIDMGETKVKEDELTTRAKWAVETLSKLGEVAIDCIETHEGYFLGYADLAMTFSKKLRCYYQERTNSLNSFILDVTPIPWAFQVNMLEGIGYTQDEALEVSANFISRNTTKLLYRADKEKKISFGEFVYMSRAYDIFLLLYYSEEVDLKSLEESLVAKVKDWPKKEKRLGIK